jgi:hypothetical protein
VLDYENVVGQDSLTRLDDRRNQNNNKNKNKSRNRNQGGRPDGQQAGPRGQKARPPASNSKVVTGPMGKDRKAAGAIARRATGPMVTASNISKAATARMGSRPGQGRKVAAAIARRAITTGAVITARGQITQTTVNPVTIIRPSLNR